MICEKCKINKPDKDFINKGNLCFRCEYQEKLKKSPAIRTKPRPALCRICKTEIVYKEDLKKNQRTVFCSLVCAHQGQKIANQIYWQRNRALYP